jgi:hypothetical protein
MHIWCCVVGAHRRGKGVLDLVQSRATGRVTGLLYHRLRINSEEAIMF